jgi:hypothetical protein
VAIALLWTWPAEPRPPRAGAALAVLAAHAAVFTALGAVFAGDGSRMGGALRFFLAFDVAPLEYLPRTAAREWLLPFFPVSLIALAGLLAPASRLPSLAFCGLAAMYVAVSFVVIPGLWERGTYCVPLAPFGAALAGRLLSPRGLAAAVALAAATAALLVLEHDRAAPDLLPAEAIAEVAREQKTLFLVEDERESDAILRAAPEIPVVRAFQLVHPKLETAELAREFDRTFAILERDGTRVCASQGALDLLLRLRPELHRHLLATYRLQPVGSQRFAAYRLAR